MVLKKRINGKVIESVDLQGGVFTPVPGKAITVAYSYGPKGKGITRNVLLQCPVSAIPDDIWALLALWWQCRTVRMQPVAGGFLDQPFMVRRAFPLFEQEYKAVERTQQQDGSQMAAALAVAGMAKVMGGA